MTEKPSFTFVNYAVCNYCKHLAVGEHRDGANYGCSLEVINGKYKPVVLDGGPLSNSICSFTGCARFEPSGLPAHPMVLEQLIAENPAARAIPSDKDALETSWDFFDKMRNYPRVTCHFTLQKEDHS